MARRIRWQIVIAALSTLLIGGLLGRLAVSTAAISSPLVGGTYIESVIGTPQKPVPLLNDPVADPVGRDLVTLLYDGLLRIGADGLIEPALASSYEVDPTGTSYIFRLRRDIVWHDGQPFGADDVLFTLRTLQVLEQPGDPALTAFWQDLLVDRIDEATIRVTLNEPLASFPSLARIRILPAHLLASIPPERWLESAYASQLIGTGPYRLVELRDERAILVANQSYFDGRPFIEQIELRFVTTRETALATLSRGDTTAFGERLRLEHAGLNPPAGLSAPSVPLDEYTVLSFNVRRSSLADQRLRQALAHGLDKSELITRALAETARSIDTPILPGSWAFSPNVSWYAPDRSTAERILGELGYVRGSDGRQIREGLPLTLELLVDSEVRRRAAADEVARQWGELGVTVNVRELGAAQLITQLRRGSFDMAIHSWARLGPDPDPFALWYSGSSLNYTGLRDELIDQLLENARQESELAARSSDYAAFQQRWIELVPSITLYQPLYRFTSDPSLGGTGFDEPANAASSLLFGPEDRYRSVTRWFTDSYREIQGELR
jgi:peptide/nickel transport system substrate-binding protein